MSSDSPFAAGVAVAPGDVLAGKYRVERVLGAGGMGVVVAARHLRLDEKVAIKFLLEEALRSAEAVARFEQEARTAVRIKSSHVARVIDVGHLDNGAPYIVMEYLEGGDLSAWLERRGALAIEQAAEFVIQACDALAEAHSMGVVHRDLKPANLFCTRGADSLFSIKLLDFGISKILWDTDQLQRDKAMTRTQALVGTPLYMSPEQMQSSRDVDARTDIWSLGIILYELLAARTPFEGDELPCLVLQIASAPVPSLRASRPDVPPVLEGVILRCLEKDPSRRFANVGELAAALGPFAPARARPLVERIGRIIDASGLGSTALAQPASDSNLATAALPASRNPTSPSGPRPPSLPPPPLHAPTIAPWGAATDAKLGPPRRRVGVLPTGALVALGLVLGSAVAWRVSSRVPVSSSATALVPASVRQAVPLAAPSAPPAPDPVASAVAFTPTVAASALPTSKPRRAIASHAASAPAAASAPVLTSSPPSKVSYDHM